MKINITIGVVILALMPSVATPEVVDSSASGFTVKTAISINANPEDVYQRLVHDVGAWWDSAHTFSGDSHNLTIQDKPMGCFCEKLSNGGGVRHMEVVFLAPGKTLGLTGALGPLQSIAASGNMRIQLSSSAGGTKLELTYAVTGYTAKGMGTWAAPVDSVVTQQFTRLKAYVEGGDKALQAQPPK
jgi:hypothetical protein